MSWGAAVPYIVAGAGAAMQAISGWMSSEAAAQASEEERQAIMDAAKLIQDNVKLPEYNQTPLTPEQYQLLQKYVPEVAKFTEEKMPQMVREAGAQQAISAQKEALKRLGDVAKTGDDVSAQAQRQLVLDESARAQASQRADILRSLAKRGLGGSGAETMALLTGGQDQAQAARQAMLQAQAGQQDRRMSALGQMANLATGMRGQEMNKEKTNVDVINEFNQRTAMRKQAYDQYAAATRNEAQQINIKAAQDTADKNVALRNQYALLNRQRQDDLAKQRYQDAMDYWKTQAGYATGSAQVAAAGQQAAAKRQSEGFGALGQALMQSPKTAYDYERYKKLSAENDNEDLDLSNK